MKQVVSITTLFRKAGRIIFPSDAYFLEETSNFIKEKSIIF